MSIRSKKSLRWLVSAVADLTEIVDRIAQDKPKAALRFAWRLKASVELLQTAPALGARCAEHKRFRFLTQGKYVHRRHRDRVVARGHAPPGPFPQSHQQRHKHASSGRRTSPNA